jgi:thiamine-phosphate pyrophosphorylase
VTGLALPPPIFCLVTDRRRLRTGSEADLVRLCGAAAAAGVSLIHVRERDLADRPLAALVRRIVAAAAGTPAAVVVNERTDVAIAAGAAGVHLRAACVEAPRVRRIVPPDFLVGRSIHAADEASAHMAGTDYLVMGTVFSTASKPDLETPAGVGALAAACRATFVPVLAIGGITADNVVEVAAAGAAGVAAIGLFADLFNTSSGPDLESVIGAAVSSLRQAFGAPSEGTRS